MLIEKKVLAI